MMGSFRDFFHGLDDALAREVELAPRTAAHDALERNPRPFEHSSRQTEQHGIDRGDRFLKAAAPVGSWHSEKPDPKRFFPAPRLVTSY